MQDFLKIYSTAQLFLFPTLYTGWTGLSWEKVWQNFAGEYGFVRGFPDGSVVKESACNTGDVGSVLGSGRYPRGGHGNPLQYSCLENSTDRGAWRATMHGVAKESDRTEETEHTGTSY